MNSAAPPDELCSSWLTRLLLDGAATDGMDPRRLARDAQLPLWALESGQEMIPARAQFRLWEVIEHGSNRPDLALTAATRMSIARLDLYGYLFATSPTLRVGLQALMEFMHLASTCSVLRVEAEGDKGTTYSWRNTSVTGRGNDLAVQFCVGSVFTLAREAVGQPVVPVSVAFAQPAPRARASFTDLFGTRLVDFSAPATMFTIATCDLDRPLQSADRALAGILRRYAATMPQPSLASWLDHFREVLDEALDHGFSSLDLVARRLILSPRTLQRRLAEHGTSWQAELDAIRQQRLRDIGNSGTAAAVSELASQLGYTTPGSVRRAIRRWAEDSLPALPRFVVTAGAVLAGALQVPRWRWLLSA